MSQSPCSLRGRARLLLALACGAVLVVAVPAYAQPATGADGEQQIRVARLVERLGAPAYEDRLAAREELENLGLETRRELQRAAASADLEVRLQAIQLLRQLAEEELWLGSRIESLAPGAEASELLEQIGGATGNRLLLGDQYGTFNDTELTLDCQDALFWKVLDDLCRQTGNHVRPRYDASQGGLVVVAGSPGQYPIAYAGPLRAQITSARRVFTEDLDYENLKSETSHSFQFNMQVMWEDRFRLVAYRSPPRVVEIVTDGGEPVAATQSAGSSWNVIGSGNRRVALDLRLHPPSTAVQSLDTMRLEWELIAVGEMAAIDVTDLAEPSEHRQDDVVLRVHDVVAKQGSRYEATVTVLRALVVPEPQDALIEDNSVELCDEQGRSFRKYGQTNSLGDEGAKMRVAFGAPAADSKPAMLRLAYPRVRSQRALEIVFKDVPLPTGRPE